MNNPAAFFWSVECVMPSIVSNSANDVDLFDLSPF